MPDRNEAGQICNHLDFGEARVLALNSVNSFKEQSDPAERRGRFVLSQ